MPGKNIILPDNYFEDEDKKQEDFGNLFLEKKTVRVNRKSRMSDYFKDFFTKRKKVALVLSGGAARGLAHIGVIKVLEREGIIPDLIVGTSMGSIVGAIYAMDADCSSFDKYLDYELRDLVALNDFSLKSGGLIKGNRVIYILSKVLGRPLTFDELKIPLKVNSADIVTGKEVVFDKGNVIDAVRASISIPLIFAPVIRDDSLLVDGGMVQPAGCHLVPKKFDVIILSDVNHYFNKIPKHSGMGNVFEQVMILIHKSLINNPYEKKTVTIRPNLEGMGLSQFHRTKEFINRGEEAAQKKIRTIKKRVK